MFVAARMAARRMGSAARAAAPARSTALRCGAGAAAAGMAAGFAWSGAAEPAKALELQAPAKKTSSYAAEGDGPPGVRVLLEGSGSRTVVTRKAHGPLRLYGGSAHPELASAISAHLGIPLGGHSTANFKNGETGCIIHDSVRDCDVFVVQPTCNPCPNEYLMELLVMMDAFRRGGASRITAIIPLFGYARQDKKDKSRAPITGKLVADMLELAGADRVITVDLHASQIQGFVSYPIDNLYAMPLMYDHIRENIGGGHSDDIVIVSPDAGGAKRAETLAKKLGADLAIFSKKREKANEVSQMILVGDVQGKKCVIVDDMVDTAGTLTLAAKQLVEYGATEVYAACSHGVLSDPALERINVSTPRVALCLFARRRFDCF